MIRRIIFEQAIEPLHVSSYCLGTLPVREYADDF
jgi:hypothetical protein